MEKIKISLTSSFFLLIIFFFAAAWQHKAAKNVTGFSEDKMKSASGINQTKGKKKIIFIAGGCSHGPGEHEYKAGSMLLADALNENMPQEVEAVFYQNSWPTSAQAFENAVAIVLFVDGGDRNIALDHLPQMEALMQKGIGLACLHYAVEVPKEKAGKEFLNWLGGFFETHWSVNPVWKAEFKSFPDHPVTRGVTPFTLTDEWYYHMRFRENMEGVTPVLTAIPPASTLNRADGPHENNPHVRAEKGQPQHVAWATERPDGGRGFGFTGGHFHKNWADDNYRKLVLNGILWIAKIEVPKAGFPLQPLSRSGLQANLEEKPCR